MKKYLLDANIIIKIWNENEKLMDEIMHNNKIRILKEVLDELSVKETREYRRRDVLSERFCKLLKCSVAMEKENISGFYMIFDCEAKEKFEHNNLSNNDLMQLYACYINEDYVLVTEDKTLLEIGNIILDNEKVINLNKFNKIKV